MTPRNDRPSCRLMRLEAERRIRVVIVILQSSHSLESPSPSRTIGSTFVGNLRVVVQIQILRTNQLVVTKVLANVTFVRRSIPINDLECLQTSKPHLVYEHSNSSIVH